MKHILNKITIIFTFCAISILSSYSMQRVMCRNSTMKPTLQKLRYCTTQRNTELEIDKKLRTKANRLLFGNAAMCTANVVASCVTHNPYFLLPLVPHVASMVGMRAIKSCVQDKSSEFDLIQALEFFAQKRTETIENLLQNINHTNKQIKWLKASIADETNLKAIGARTELLEEYTTTLYDREKLKYELEHKLIEHIAPIFDMHKNANLHKCILYNEKKIAILNKVLLFKLPALPLAILPTFIRNTKNTFPSYSDAWQFLICFDTAGMAIVTLLAASIFPLEVASGITNMEMAFQNKFFFEQNILNQKKESLQKAITLIKLHQNHRIDNN